MSLDISAITGRIDQIRRAAWLPTPAPGSASFRDRLATAVAAREAAPAEAPTVDGPEATQRHSIYYTLGGSPVSVAPFVGWTPSAFEGGVTDWASQLPEEGRPYADSIQAAASDAGLDPRLLAAVVWAESSFTPDAVSSAGAIGLAQLMPGTAQGLGVDPWDAEANLKGGAEYLSNQIARFESVELGLAAYNAGPARVLEHGGAPSYTQDYIARVRGYFERLGGS